MVHHPTETVQVQLPKKRKKNKEKEEQGKRRTVREENKEKGEQGKRRTRKKEGRERGEQEERRTKKKENKEREAYWNIRRQNNRSSACASYNTSVASSATMEICRLGTLSLSWDASADNTCEKKERTRKSGVRD